VSRCGAHRAAQWRKTPASRATDSSRRQFKPTWPKSNSDGSRGRKALLAREKGATRAVRQLGIRLVNDQQSANEDAVLAARHMDVAAPQTPNSRQVAAYGKLGRLSGESFDREFIQAELKDDERDIALYDYEAGHNSGPAASYAEETLYELEEHRKMAEDAEREEQPRRG